MERFPRRSPADCFKCRRPQDSPKTLHSLDVTPVSKLVDTPVPTGGTEKTRSNHSATASGAADSFVPRVGKKRHKPSDCDIRGFQY